MGARSAVIYTQLYFGRSMIIQRTLSIIKPDIIKLNIIGKVINYIEQYDLKVIALQSRVLTKKQAEAFYSAHKNKDFFDQLVQFMSSGMIVTQVLQGPNAIAKYREVMGDTDPKKAKKGTIRGDLGTDIMINCVHGSDSVENAVLEIETFFPGLSKPPNSILSYCYFSAAFPCNVNDIQSCKKD